MATATRLSGRSASRLVGWSVVLGLITPPVVAARNLPAIRAQGVLKVLVNLDTHRPEFFSTAPASPPGFDQEVLLGFAKLERLQLEIVPVDGWGALIPALLAGKGDVIAGRFTATDGRRRQIEFTHEVFPYRLVVMTRKPHRVVTTLDQLREERVGTTTGSSLLEAIVAAGVPAANTDDDVPTGGYVDALKSGRITAAVWGVESAIASQREDPAIQLGMYLGSPGSLAFGVRKEDTLLRSALDEYIDNTRRTPTWNRLVVKYFGADAPEVLKRARTTEAR